MMRKAWIWPILLGLASCGSLQFKQMQLYDQYQQPAPAAKTEEIVYSDAKGTLWHSLFECGKFEFSNEAAYSGKTSIKLSWDKSKGCEWIGFGNSFSNWAATDMTEQLPHKALSLHVRTIEGKAKSMPIVACLEDFGGGGSYLFLDAKQYLKGLEIDTNWKEMIVPLWDFPVREDEVDMASIKQMKFQLEGAGAFFLDEIKLIDFEQEDFLAMRAEVEASKPKGQPQQQVYPTKDFAFAVWGYEANACQTLYESKTEGGEAIIHWNFEKPDCKQREWGINWNEWYPVNLRGLGGQTKVLIEAKRSAQATWRLLLEDFAGHSVEIASAESIALTEADTWQQLSFELPDLQAKGFVQDQIRQLKFVGLKTGRVEIKSIRIDKK